MAFPLPPLRVGALPNSTTPPVPPSYPLVLILPPFPSLPYLPVGDGLFLVPPFQEAFLPPSDEKIQRTAPAGVLSGAQPRQRELRGGQEGEGRGGEGGVRRKVEWEGSGKAQDGPRSDRVDDVPRQGVGRSTQQSTRGKGEEHSAQQILENNMRQESGTREGGREGRRERGVACLCSMIEVCGVPQSRADGRCVPHVRCILGEGKERKARGRRKWGQTRRGRKTGRRRGGGGGEGGGGKGGSGGGEERANIPLGRGAG